MKKKQSPLPMNPELKSNMVYCFHRAALAFREVLAEELVEWGIVPPQLGMLKILSTVGPMSQVHLGEEMMIDKASMVKLIDGLEKFGFLSRSGQQQDRRVKLLEITPKGRKVLEKMVSARLRAEEKFLRPLTAAERASLKKILPKLLESFLAKNK